MTTKRIRVVDRTIALLEALADAESDLGVGELAHVVGLPKSSVHRVLVSLLDRGMVALDPRTERYSLGLSVLKLRAAAWKRLTIRDLSFPHLLALRDMSGETATLTQRVGLQRMYVDQLESSHELRYTVETGRLLPLYPGAGGKAILAWLAPEKIDEVLNQLKAQSTPVDRVSLHTELSRIREDGFALSAGERVAHNTAVSSAILRSDGDPVGAIGISGPAARFTIEDARRCGPAVAQAAADISTKWNQLGH